MKANEIKPGAKFACNGVTYTVQALRNERGRILVLSVDHTGRTIVFRRTQLMAARYRAVPQWQAAKVFSHYRVARWVGRKLEYYSPEGTPVRYGAREHAQKAADELNKT